MTSFVLSVIFLLSPCAGQVLDLSGPPEPPVLDGETLLSSTLTTLEQEIESLSELARSGDERTRVSLYAQVNARIIAADLLRAADRAGAHGSVAFIMAMKLVDARAELDAALTQDWSRHAQAAEVERLLRKFSEVAARDAELVRTHQTQPLDEHVPVIIAPLSSALCLLNEADSMSHWPLVQQVRTGASRPRLELDELKQNLTGATMPANLRQELRTAIEFLESGLAFDELHGAIERSTETIARIINITETIHRAAAWCDAALLDELQLQLLVCARLHQEPGTRSQGLAQLEVIDIAASLLQRMNVVDNRPAREIETIRTGVVDAVNYALHQDNVGDIDTRALARLGAVLDRMQAWKDRPRVEVPRQLRRSYRDLERQYETVEEALIEQLEAIARVSGAQVDASIAGLMIDQQQYLDDVLVLGQANGWGASLEAIDREAAIAFSIQLRKLARWLTQPQHRDAAREVLHAFAQQHDELLTFAQEERWQSGAPEIVRLTGGRHAELLETLNNLRAEWAISWGKGDVSSDAARQLALVQRLAHAIERTHRVESMISGNGRRNAPPPLNRWAAWWLPTPVIARVLSDVPGRVKLAAGAVVKGEYTKAARHLDRVDDDSPLARVLGHLAAHLEPSLAMLPGGVCGGMGQLVHPPSRDAWQVGLREELASLCRYAAERAYAQQHGHDERATLLQAYVNETGPRLMRRLAGGGIEFPTVPGFDGSDPTGDQLPE